MHNANTRRSPGRAGRGILAVAFGIAGVASVSAFQGRPIRTEPTRPATRDPIPLTKSLVPKCEPDNGGITLPAGFCAVVFADKLGAARHMVVSASGDVYVAMQRGRGPATAPGIVVLRDSDGDGKVDKQETFGSLGGGGIALSGNFLLSTRGQRLFGTR